MTKYPKTAKCDQSWIEANWMGPNPLWLLEDLCQHMDLRPGVKVLDMGCGKGLCEITACYDIENPKEVWQGWAEWSDQNKDADFGEVNVDIDETSDVEFLAADTNDDIALIVIAAKKCGTVN